MKIRLTFLFGFLLAGLLLNAQSNEILDQLLAEEQLSAGSAAYLIVSLADPARVPDSRERAFEQLKTAVNMEPVSATAPGDTVSIGEFSYLLQQHLGLSRGLGSRFMPGPRYALRDLKFLKLVQGRVYPSMALSGERAIRIIGRVLAETEEQS